MHLRRFGALPGAIIVLALISACGTDPGTQQSGNGEETSQSDAGSAVSSAEKATMPDLVGEGVAEAEEALQELGVQFDTVTKASAEDNGVVLSQDPVRGEPLDGVKVTITVAGDPPAVPEVTGLTFVEAKQQLEKQGFTVKENAILDGSATDGVVVAQDPGVGTANAATVTLDVARRPVASALADMSLLSVEGTVQSEQAKANGVIYPSALLVGSRYSDNPTTFGVDLSRSYRQVVGQIGISDESDDTCTATVSFSGDGRTLGESPYDLSFGETQDVAFTVDGVLRLAVTAAPNGDECTIVLGDFRAEGLESEVEASPSPSAQG